jgi:iron(III) transport system substrate-binding protein
MVRRPSPRAAADGATSVTHAVEPGGSPHREVSMNRLAVMLATLALLGAALSQELVVYNAGSSELIEDTIAAFNRDHPGISVTVVSAGVGQHTTRIEAEAGNPRGDVFFGASVESFEAIIGMFEPYQAAHHDEYDPVFVHPEFRYYGYSQPLQAFVVNTTLLSEDEMPRSWADLADGRFEGKIIMANPSLSGSAYAQLAQMLQLYDWDLIEDVVRNTTFVSSSQLVFQNVARGEIEIGITGEANIAMLIEEGWPVVAIYPEEGTGLRFDAMGIIAGGPNPESARVFMDWATTLANHEIAAQHYRRSVRADAPAPVGLTPTADVPTFPYDPDLAAQTRDENLRRFDEIFSAR